MCVLSGLRRNGFTLRLLLFLCGVATQSPDAQVSGGPPQVALAGYEWSPHSRLFTINKEGWAAAGDSVSRLSQLLSAFSRAEPEVMRFWPGFWERTCGLVIAGPDGAALLILPPPRSNSPERDIRDRNTPARFTARSTCLRSSWEVAKGLSVSAALRNRVFESRVPALAGDGPTYLLDFDAGGVVVPAIRLQSNPPDVLGFALHEAFHKYQREYFDTVGQVSEVVPTSILQDSAFVARAERERTLLQRVLLAETTTDLCRRSNVYLRARRSRLADVDPHVAAVERQIERLEGSAELVGLVAFAAASNLSVDSTATDSTRSHLSRPLEQFSAGMDPTWRLMRWRLYGTGAAMGVILTRLNVAWQAQLESGVPFDVMLTSAVGSSCRGHLPRPGNGLVN